MSLATGQNATPLAQPHEEDTHIPTYAEHSQASQEGDSTAQLAAATVKTKQDATISATGFSEDKSNVANTQREISRPWRTTVLRFGPISGIFGMILSVVCIVACIGVLAGSNHQPVDNWSAPPSTYLAILTAIANLSIRYAALQGVVIAWWYRASSSNGSTLAKLHWDWRSGTTLRGALTSGRHMGLLGLACIFSTVVVIDGPLLQRASTVVPADITDHPVSLHVSMAPEIPTGLTGHWATTAEAGLYYPGIWSFNRTAPTGNGDAPTNIHGFYNDFMAVNVIGKWYNNEPLTAIKDCPGTCTAKIHAPALAVTSCTSFQHPVNYSIPDSALLNEVVAPPLNHEGFFISTLLMLQEDETIDLITGFADTDDGCVGTLHYQACSLRSAIGEYDVKIQGERAELLNPASPKIIAFANNTGTDHTPGNQYQHSTLGGIVCLMYARWEVIVYFTPVSRASSRPQQWSSGNLDYHKFQKSGGECPSFDDPHTEMLAEINRLMVHSGAEAAKLKDVSDLQSNMDPGLSVEDSITGYLHGSQSVFHTNYSFAAAAVIVELVCIAFILPTYWGWWSLGRSCSFSPLELAKAFESPLLSNCNSNSSGRDIANSIGELRVRYGVTAAHEHTDHSKLAFADPDAISRPAKGQRFEI